MRLKFYTKRMLVLLICFALFMVTDVGLYIWLRPNGEADTVGPNQDHLSYKHRDPPPNPITAPSGDDHASLDMTREMYRHARVNLGNRHGSGDIATLGLWDEWLPVGPVPIDPGKPSLDPLLDQLGDWGSTTRSHDPQDK